MAHEVFVSYSTKDKPVADAVVTGLESNGIRCWFAPRDVTPGTSWGHAIADAIEANKQLQAKALDEMDELLDEIEEGIQELGEGLSDVQKDLDEHIECMEAWDELNEQLNANVMKGSATYLIFWAAFQQKSPLGMFASATAVFTLEVDSIKIMLEFEDEHQLNPHHKAEVRHSIIS